LSLFYFLGGDGTDRAGLGGGYIPRRCTPAHSSAPGQTAQHRQQEQTVPDAGQTTQGKAHTPGRWTRCTGLHSIPDRPRGGDRAGCGTLEGVQLLYHAHYDSSITSMVY
jgi:hypothetical protein